MTSESPAKKEAKERIVSAAGEVFAEWGFRDTTIRKITARAGVNVAAVNYYFRDKEELYHCVLREAKSQEKDLYFENLEGFPEEKLRGFIQRFVRQLLDPNRPSWHMNVITREMLHPTPALDMLAEEMVEPVCRRLRGVIGEVVGRNLPAAELHLLAASILGQCLFHRRSRSMLERIAPELTQDPHQIERIADHIATFSLAALQRLFHPTPQLAYE